MMFKKEIKMNHTESINTPDQRKCTFSPSLTKTFGANKRDSKDPLDKTSDEKKEEDYTDVGTTTPQKNKIDKFGGEPKADESIANRGTQKPKKQ